MQPFGNHIPVNQVPDQRIFGVGPLAAGLIGAGLGYLGGELFDGPYGYGPGYGGYGPGFGPGPGYVGYGGGYGPGFPGYGYHNYPGYKGYPGYLGYKPGLF